MKGVTKTDRETLPWRADVQRYKTRTFLGRFATKEEAEAAVQRFKAETQLKVGQRIVTAPIESFEERFERLCATYKTFTQEGVERLLEAARLVDEPWGIVERKFLQGFKDVDVSSEYRAAYADLVDKLHNASRTRAA